MLCCVGYVFCPISNGMINLRYTECIKNLDEVSEYNWCEHILEKITKSDFHFLMVHSMDMIKKDGSSSAEPMCAKWTTEQIFVKFDKLAKEKRFGSAIGMNITMSAECSNFGIKSEYDGVGNVQQMPSTHSCEI
ncbi:hypothetical protein LIER_42522 [Lithospermum erythrorhizon]|uniref:Uncharacterized protein n=1 Tax=Lithospermum erythrorhizon TaxID=34254 RepID=A0AAV3RR21_LITER